MVRRITFAYIYLPSLEQCVVTNFRSGNRPDVTLRRRIGRDSALGCTVYICLPNVLDTPAHCSTPLSNILPAAIFLAGRCLILGPGVIPVSSCARAL